MNRKTALKYILPLSLAVSIAACSANPGIAPVGLDDTIKAGNNVLAKGTLLINLAELFSASESFSVKRFNFTDSEVDMVRVTISSVDQNGNLIPDIEKETDRSEGFNNLAISVDAGKNKVVTIETFDQKEIVLSRLMAAVTVDAGVSKTLRINYGTYPTAMVLKKLMDNADQNVRKLAHSVELAKLEAFMNVITGYNVDTNTYEGINPAYVDVDSIVNSLIANTGTVPTYTRGNFDTIVKGKLRVTVRDTDGDILKNIKLTINDLTADNVNSTTDDTTTIDNVSQGQWLLRATGTANGQTAYAEQIINITPGNLNQNINMVLQEPAVVRVEFEEISDNVPVPANLELSTGLSTLIKAKVIMSDHTTNTNLTWTSSNTSVAGVSGGSINGIEAGTAVIRAASTKDNTKFVEVNVTVVARGNTGDGPVINRFSPSGTSTGAEVIIYGTNFDNSSPGANSVSFNGVNATILDATKTELKVIVPNGATTGKITVITAKGTYVSNGFFVVSSPSNTSGMIFIPGGEFEMGNNGDEDKDFYPRHKVNIAAFHIDKFEVTNKQFEDFINAGGYTNDAYWSSEGLSWRNSNSVTEPAYWHDTRFNRPEQPVVGVSWYEAEAYAKYKNRRLPTEAEWELAAKGLNDSRVYPWGGTEPFGGTDRANGFDGNLGAEDGYQYTAEVGSYNPVGDSPYGLQDMSGNAYEWVGDWYNASYYKNSPSENPQGPNVGGTKVLRGGSWFNHPYFENESSKRLDSLKTYHRFFSSPANRSNYIGFRTAK